MFAQICGFNCVSLYLGPASGYEFVFYKNAQIGMVYVVSLYFGPGIKLLICFLTQILKLACFLLFPSNLKPG